MTSPDEPAARKLAHADLTRTDQVICLIWLLRPTECDEMVDAVEPAGVSTQNRTRLKSALKASPLVSKGKTQNSFRINTKHEAVTKSRCRTGALSAL